MLKYADLEFFYTYFHKTSEHSGESNNEVIMKKIPPETDIVSFLFLQQIGKNLLSINHFVQKFVNVKI
jgi:hypothetical protein